MPNWSKKFGYGDFVHLEHHKPGFAKMMRGSQFFREIHENCWNEELRMQEYEKFNTQVQVVCTIPVMFSYWAKPYDCLELSKFFTKQVTLSEDGKNIKAKILARMKNFDCLDRKEFSAPPFLHRGKELDPERSEQSGNVMRGLGVARGHVTGKARIAKSLKDIGKVRHGEILVVNSTDPGWTPVFSVIAGIVLETGGMTAHGACLAREYGMPAVQLVNALQLIPDEATISLDGANGQVTLVEIPCLSDAVVPSI